MLVTFIIICVLLILARAKRLRQIREMEDGPPIEELTYEKEDAHELKYDPFAADECCYPPRVGRDLGGVREVNSATK